MNNRKENEQSCIVMNKKEGTSCITTHLLSFLSFSNRYCNIHYSFPLTK